MKYSREEGLQCHYWLRHLKEVFDGWNVAGTFRPPVVVHIVSDLQTNTGCRRLRSDRGSLEKKKTRRKKKWEGGRELKDSHCFG